MTEVACGMVFEVRWQRPGADRSGEVSTLPPLRFIAPSGREHEVIPFWAGGEVWKARIAPDEIGTWRYEIDGRAESFLVQTYSGENPVYRRGALVLAADRLRLATADGQPFFWLADTAWNGVLRAEAADWDRYLEARREQGFNVIQFVVTPWRGLERDAAGETAFEDGPPFRINPSFFERLDAKVAAINARGLYAATVMLWGLTPSDPGYRLSDADGLALARYIQARYGAYQGVWFLGGDADYRKIGLDKWKQWGRGLFGARHERSAKLVTLHPCGISWPATDFADEGWYDFIGYQSGHGDSEEHLRWLVGGPPALAGLEARKRPIVNLEPNYEGFISYHSKRKLTDYEVRRAAWWSCLLAPTAGITYGCNEIWNWGVQTEAIVGHAECGRVAPWHTMLDSSGSRCMTLLRQFFERLPWWRLRPAPQMLMRQPGLEQADAHVAVALADNGRVAVAYLPKGGSLLLRTDGLNRPSVASWFDPSEGRTFSAGVISGTECTLEAPDKRDWVWLAAGQGPGG